MSVRSRETSAADDTEQAVEWAAVDAVVGRARAAQARFEREAEQATLDRASLAMKACDKDTSLDRKSVV